jgi:hypothetical protein
MSLGGVRFDDRAEEAGDDDGGNTDGEFHRSREEEKVERSVSKCGEMAEFQL